MKRRVVVSLLVLVACAASGAVASALHTRATTATMRRLIELHQIEQLRQHLIIAVQNAQSDLLTVNTALGAEADVIVENVERLDAAAQRCAGCHHEPPVAARLERLATLVTDYETSLSSYITASADRERISRLKLEAVDLGAQLLTTTEEMSQQASRRLEELSAAAMQRIDEARVILFATLIVTLLLALAVAGWLSRTITRPIESLVGATRALASGQLGYEIPADDPTEFGELARHFNTMSVALSKGYSDLQAQIRERERAEEQLVHDAFHDALTGLPNRALFLDRLAHVAAGSARDARPYAVLFLDLDRFKVVNDSLGHATGDRLLAAVGERVARCLRPGDTLARLGGDEFGALLERLRGPNDAAHVSQRVLDALSQAFDVDGHEIFARASIGVALGSERDDGPEGILRDADVAMYQAKAKGKGCYVIFDAALHGSVVSRLQLESELRRAVEHGGEFLLDYQPILELASSRLVGLEALIRWRSPTHGLLSPGDFIPLAEEGGLIQPIGEWAVAAALGQLRDWRERHPRLASLTMSVNISARQFARPDFVARLERILAETGVDARQVALEVTESAIMDDVAASAAKLSRLRERGMAVHVDDFGTGYSSLAYLHRFPITALKIDRSFVARLGSDGGSEALVRAILSVAEMLKLEVIAEGVEDAGQLAALERLGCRYAQGYLLARPMPPDEAERWAAARPATG